MTPKEKAFTLLTECDKPPGAKQTALITAQEVLNELEKLHSIACEVSPELSGIIANLFEHWSGVKGELKDF